MIPQPWLTLLINIKYLPIIISKIDPILNMVDPQAVASKKRSLTYMHANDLSSRLKSKTDFIVYLDKHRKCLKFYRLTLLQSSTIFLIRT